MLFVTLAMAAPSPVPTREIPPAVLVELQELENRFELALGEDCAADICYSKGCVWLDHAVADQKRGSSMPGLSQEPGPSAAISQEYLTRAQCSFAHESTLEGAKASTLVRRLQTRMTRGWTVVSVDHEVLPALVEPVPEEAPVEEAPPEEPPPPPPEPEWSLASAAEELWETLLPHTWWMVALGLTTASIVTLIWASRRVGTISPEEQALLAQMGQPEPTPAAVEEAAPEAGEAERAWVAEQEAAWNTTLQAMDPASPDPELQAMVRDRLRAGDLPLLAKAVLRFPDRFPRLFPSDGETATAKLELAELLQNVDAATLPGDAEFFRALQRHSLAAALANQPDAQLVRSLREDFGAAGLADLIGRLPARLGALLFALAPPIEQLEIVRLLSPAQLTAAARQLLRSTRMDSDETRALLDVLAGAGHPVAGEVTDRGAAFDAPGALAVLLPALDAGERAALFAEALARHQGTLPAWTRAILVPEMLFALGPEARADLFLELEAEPLAAWFSLVDPDTRTRLLEGLPDSLRRSIQASSVFPSRSRQVSLAGRGRRELARGFVRQLARAGLSFEGVVAA